MDDYTEPDDPTPTCTTSEAARRKSCADTAQFHLRLAREALVGLDADVSELDSLIEDTQEASRYYTHSDQAA